MFVENTKKLAQKKISEKTFFLKLHHMIVNYVFKDIFDHLGPVYAEMTK